MEKYSKTSMSLKTQYKSMTEEVTAKLEKHPIFRDWNERCPYLAVLAMRACGFDTFKLFEGEVNIPFTIDKLISFAIKYDSYRNVWDAVMKEHKDWQTESYDKGKIMEQQVILAKGYQPGHSDAQKKVEKEMEEAIKNW